MASLLKTLRVLILDDTPLMCVLLRAILWSGGVRDVEAVSDPHHALRLFSGAPYDVAFVDWEMPEMSGIEFIKAVRDQATSRNPYIPIIMVSAHAEPARVLEAQAAGVHEYLTKPITGRSVLDHLEAVINNPRPFLRTDTYFGPAPRAPLTRVSDAIPGELVAP